MQPDRPPKVSYVIHFRTSRGAGGVEHETARAEFLAAARHLPITILDEHPAFRRIFVYVPPATVDRFMALLHRLGYTEALTRITRQFGAGVGMQHQEATKVERWLVGEYRRGDDRVVHELVWQVDDAPRLARSPHERYFKMRIDGHVEATRSLRQRRRLSCCDALVMLHLARVDPGAFVVDPFAGIGGIVQEGRRLGLEMLCGDVDRSLGPGLREVGSGLAAIWDASELPLPADCAEAVVTEPPYADERHEDVLAAMPEIARILRPGATAIVLIDEEMAEDLLRAGREAGLWSEEQYLVRRASGMKAQLLVMTASG
ncbi:MAG: hypothetical protein GF393_06665 [Armatimonadia bacterium]|nr:hypothetical protein [Armatimonadia bacterium]